MPQTSHVPFSISSAIKIQGGWYEKDLMKASTAELAILNDLAIPMPALRALEGPFVLT